MPRPDGSRVFPAGSGGLFCDGFGAQDVLACPIARQQLPVLCAALHESVRVHVYTPPGMLVQSFACIWVKIRMLAAAGSKAYRLRKIDGDGTGCRTFPPKPQMQVLLCMNGCAGRVDTHFHLESRLHIKQPMTMPQTMCQSHVRMWLGGAALAGARQEQPLCRLLAFAALPCGAGPRLLAAVLAQLSLPASHPYVSRDVLRLLLCDA